MTNEAALQPVAQGVALIDEAAYTRAYTQFCAAIEAYQEARVRLAQTWMDEHYPELQCVITSNYVLRGGVGGIDLCAAPGHVPAYLATGKSMAAIWDECSSYLEQCESYVAPSQTCPDRRDHLC